MENVKELKVDLGERSYPIWIGKHVLEDISQYLTKLHIKPQNKILLITDDAVAPLYGHALQKKLEEEGYTVCCSSVPEGESSKSMHFYEQIMTYAIEQRLDRKSVILALGGGVVGDLAGFVASTFMRGIPFIQIPTTLLAHDSSVGGKVAINHPLGKNMIGSFYQPLAVLYDTHTLTSLPARQVRSGFAEVLKHGFIWDESFVEWLWTHRQQCQQLQEPYISELLWRACQIKSHVVSQDEKEEGIRAILNLGHTFGHAFEALGEYGALTHGEAISIGMVLAAKVSESVYSVAGLSERVVQLLDAYGLPVQWQDLPWSVDQVLAKMYADKKVVSGSLNLVLLERMGRAKLVQGVDPDLIKQIW